MVVLSSVNQKCGQGDSLEIILSRKACNHYPYLSSLVSFHSNCSEGTCDGCTFHFLWESQNACPLCTRNHYKEIVSACIQGIQVVLHRHGRIDKNHFTSPTSQIHHRSITNSCCVERITLRFKNLRLDYNKKSIKFETRSSISFMVLEVRYRYSETLEHI